MKRVFSIIIILGLGSTVSAQDYYTGRDRITADGITFLASVYQGVPAIAEQTPQKMYAMYFVLTTLTPDNLAASSFPPTAYK